MVFIQVKAIHGFDATARRWLYPCTVQNHAQVQAARIDSCANLLCSELVIRGNRDRRLSLSTLLFRSGFIPRLPKGPDDAPLDRITRQRIRGRDMPGEVTITWSVLPVANGTRHGRHNRPDADAPRLFALAERVTPQDLDGHDRLGDAEHVFEDDDPDIELFSGLDPLAEIGLSPVEDAR